MEFLTLFFQNLTRMVCLSVVLLMASVWAYLSIESGMIQPVSENFLYIGGMILAGEFGAAAGISKKVGDKLNGQKAD